MTKLDQPSSGDAGPQRLEPQVAYPREFSQRPIVADHPDFHGAEDRRRDATRGHGVRTWSSGGPLGRTATALQLRRDGIGEVGLDFVDMADDAARVQLVAS